MLSSKARQIGFGLATPRATVGYPLAPLAPDPAYRGRVVVETDLCTGCGGCADVCPARCIEIHDPSRTERVIVRRLDRCILCGRCADACAYDAVRLEADWETATPDRAALVVEQHLFMGACDRCGRCAIPAHPLDHVVVGLRPAPAGGAGERRPPAGASED
jgi:formate hydrogenlyase subunit 6/NADH:ubiquinone oxidoreductase subunit I